ncbi:MAG TPA: transposase [Thermoanaerobaculia bacterium]|nr:transposase [Thermoanaerobaculia bacterium]
METTWAERQTAEYQKKFFEEGIRSVLLRQIEQRFGEIPLAVRARIETIDSRDELDGLIDRILIGASGTKWAPGNGAAPE